MENIYGYNELHPEVQCGTGDWLWLAGIEE